MGGGGMWVYGGGDGLFNDWVAILVCGFIVVEGYGVVAAAMEREREREREREMNIKKWIEMKNKRCNAVWVVKWCVIIENVTFWCVKC